MAKSRSELSEALVIALKKEGEIVNGVTLPYLLNASRPPGAPNPISLDEYKDECEQLFAELQDRPPNTRVAFVHWCTSIKQHIVSFIKLEDALQGTYGTVFRRRDNTPSLIFCRMLVNETGAASLKDFAAHLCDENRQTLLDGKASLVRGEWRAFSKGELERIKRLREE